MGKRINSINNTMKHRKCFIALERHFLNSNPRGYTHDIEKPFLYLFLGVKLGSKIHKKFSRHHKQAKGYYDYVEMVIDWESARFTKHDKPLNAYNTLYKYYPELEPHIMPILKAFGLDHDDPKDYPKRSQFDFKI